MSHPGDDILKEEITRLKREKGIVILAHYYQEPDVQDVADFVGDSLGLSMEVRKTTAKSILFAGVRFMAQTAKIINPACRVLIPEPEAGCSLSDSCPPDQFREFLARHPGHTVVSYVNCSAEVKAMSDVICTSANAEKIVRSVPTDRPIVFAPDKNLGKYLIEKTGREMVLWDGACVVHEAFAIDKLLDLHGKFPNARIVAHPEAETHILKVANFIGSTTGMINFVKNDSGREYIVATEAGILHAMSREVPEKVLIPAPSHEDNTCACSECPYMKMTTLGKIYRCLYDEAPTIELDESIRTKALVPLMRMLEISQN